MTALNDPLRAVGKTVRAVTVGRYKWQGGGPPEHDFVKLEFDDGTSLELKSQDSSDYTSYLETIVPDTLDDRLEQHPEEHAEDEGL